MVNILIVYASDYGSTEKMAKAAAAGAESVGGVHVVVKKAEDVSADDFLSSAGVLVGTPVHMGGMDWRIKKMIDTVCSGLWMKNEMIGRVAGVFASGSGYGNGGSGVELAMLSILNNFAELGMIIVPLPKNTEGYKQGGLQWGAYGRSADEDMNHVGVAEVVLGVARRHGVHVARLAKLVVGTKVLA